MADLFDIEESSRINELVSLIKRYQTSYYNGEGEISDAEFDALWDELKNLDPENEILKKIGTDSGNFAKLRHVMPMGSQEKAANPEQFLGWASKHVYDEYFEIPQSDTLCCIYSIAEVSMCNYLGFLAILKNKEKPLLQVKICHILKLPQKQDKA